ncbi:MAG: YceI family protein [Chitinophagaceae bacterium]|nr:YceI family protein [Chitinophagaceae bacterium]
MVKHLLLSLVFVFSGSLYVVAQSNTSMYKSIKSSVQFFSETPIENIDAISKSMVSAINTSNQNVAAVIAIKTFHFNNAFMEEHFNEKYMESDKYPKATFSGLINEKINFKEPGSYKITVTGKLNIHGVEKVRTISGTLTIDPSMKLNLHTTFDVKLVDHHIEVPQLVMQKVAEVIRVTIDEVYEMQ